MSLKYLIGLKLKFITNICSQCTDGLNIGDLTVIAGTSTLHRGGERRRVIGVNQHPRYGERGQGDYDVSILTVRDHYI